MVFKPGQSGNPGGRPKGAAGVAKLIHEATGGGKELVEWALTIWRDATNTMTDRKWAFDWLSNRYMGTPVSMGALMIGDVSEATVRNIAALSDGDIAEIDRMFRVSEGLPILDVASVEAPKAIAAGPLTHTFVGSSNIAGATLEANGLLTVRFMNGGSYKYENVNVDEWKAWLEADSAGSFFASQIRAKHPQVKT